MRSVYVFCAEGFGSVERLARTLANNGYRTIVIVGGDGAFEMGTLVRFAGYSFLTSMRFPWIMEILHIRWKSFRDM